jgi:hypothetical protein
LDLWFCGFNERKKAIRKLGQKDKWVYFPLVDHAFEVHGRSGKHDIDVIALYPFVVVAAQPVIVF